MISLNEIWQEASGIIIMMAIVVVGLAIYFINKKIKVRKGKRSIESVQEPVLTEQPTQESVFEGFDDKPEEKKQIVEEKTLDPLIVNATNILVKKVKTIDENIKKENAENKLLMEQKHKEVSQRLNDVKTTREEIYKLVVVLKQSNDKLIEREKILLNLKARLR